MGRRRRLAVAIRSLSDTGARSLAVTITRRLRRSLGESVPEPVGNAS